MRLRTRTEPTRRTLERLRQQGYVADICERKQGPISRDLFGAFDIVGFRAGNAIVVQTTGDSGGNFAKRVGKVQCCPDLPALLAAGVVVEVHAWKPEKLEPRTWTA